MKAIVITRPGGPEVLEIVTREDPRPDRGELVVRVHAAGVNRADLLQRAGSYPAPADAPLDVPGLEYAGIVEAVGGTVTGWKEGDRVFGLVPGGAYAEKLVVQARAAVKMPAHMSFTDAAASPEAFITSWDAMVTQCRLGAGEWVLVSAVGSGVGTAAVQIARAIGARSVGTSRTPDKLTKARELGMDAGVVVPSSGAFADAVRNETGGGGADVVLELVGGAYVAEDLKCLAPRGRLALVGLLAGRQAEMDLGAILQKRIELRGTMLRSRPLEERFAAMQAFARHVVPLLSRGTLRPVVDRIFPLARAADAHAYLAKNEGFGKVLLEVS